MGSYLDNGFLNGSKNINRGEKAEITNENTITPAIAIPNFDTSSLPLGAPAPVAFAAIAGIEVRKKHNIEAKILVNFVIPSF